jgi:hypothetical protein
MCCSEVVITDRIYEIKNDFLKCKNSYVFEGSRSEHLVGHTEGQQGSERMQVRTSGMAYRSAAG